MIKSYPVEKLRQSFHNGFKPNPTLNYDDWAESHFYLSDGSAIKGLVRLDLIPYAREVLQNLSWTSMVQEEIVMKGIQLAFTTVADIVLQGTIDTSPCPILMLFGSESMALEHVTLRFEPSIENNPHLKGKVFDPSEKKGKSRKLLKVFPGGSIKFGSGKTAKSYRMYSAAIVILDDVDAFADDIGGTANKEGEGSPLKLIEGRTAGRQGKYKRYYSGSPTNTDTSIIYNAYEDTDQRKYFVPCPECGHKQIIDFFRIKYESDSNRNLISDPYLECESCKTHIDENEKYWMMNNGEWMPTNHSKKSKRKVGRWISSAYSLLGYTWADMCEDWLDAIKDKERGKLKKMITFYNTKLGLPWSSNKQSKRVEPSSLYKSRDKYEVVPAEGVVICAGFDVQINRIEGTVVSYDSNEDRYFLEHTIIGGSPWIKYGLDGSPWDTLEQFIFKKYKNHAGSEQPILSVAIDTGYCTENTSSFIYQMQGLGVDIYGVFGSSIKGKSKTLLSNPIKNKYGFEVREYNVDEGKTITDIQLRTGKIHFNEHPSFTEQFFHQLTIERLITKKVKGETVQMWSCPESASNEATDTTNYCYAAFSIYNEHGINWGDFKKWNSKGCTKTTVNQKTIISEGVKI